MPFAEMPWGHAHCRIRGSGASAPVLYLHSLLADGSMWDAVVSHLGEKYLAVQMDLRGHGASGAPPGPYELGALADDAVRLMDALGVSRSHVVGAGFGGMVAQQLALDRPDRVMTLTSSSSAAIQGDPGAWDARMAQATSLGVQSLVEPTLKRWFSPGFLDQDPDQADRIRRVIGQTPLAGYLGSAAAVQALDQTRALLRCQVPALVIGAALDQAMPVECGRELHRLIPGALYTEVPTGSHMLALERPDTYANAIRHHLEHHPQ